MGKPCYLRRCLEVIDFNTKNGGLILVAKTCDEFMDYIPKAINDSGQIRLINELLSPKTTGMQELKK